MANPSLYWDVNYSMPHQSNPSSTQDETFTFHVDGEWTEPTGEDIIYEYYIEDSDGNKIVNNSGQSNSTININHTIDIHQNYNLDFYMYIEGNTNSVQQANGYIKDFNGNRQVECGWDYESPPNNAQSCSDFGGANYISEVPYISSDSYQSPTKSFTGRLIADEAEIDCTINSGESLDITFTDDDGQTVSHSLSDGVNTYDVSSLNDLNSASFDISASNSSEDDSPTIDSVRLYALGGVKYYDGANWSYKTVKRWDGSSWINVLIKNYDGTNWTT